MKYHYDYRFLSRYMEENNLSKKDLLEALGVKDYVSLNRWLDGKTPIHTAAMLRLCNYYQIPLSSFFMDADSKIDGNDLDRGMHPILPNPDAQPLPTADYGMGDHDGTIKRGYGIVDPSITDRTMSTFAQRRAVEKGYLAAPEYSNTTETPIIAAAQHAADMETPNTPTPNALPTDTPAPPEQQQPEQENTTQEATVLGDSVAEPLDSVAEPLPIYDRDALILRLRLDHANELRRLEQSHRDREDTIRQHWQKKLDEQHDRLFSLIEKQQEELNRLRKKG